MTHHPRLFRRLLLVTTVGMASAAVAQEPCPVQPMPAPLKSSGMQGATGPVLEVIRFSAAPSRQRMAYAVEITRTTDAGANASVRVVELERQRSCNRYERIGEWRFPLSSGQTRLFFEEAAEIEAELRPQDEITVDGTSFEYEHRQGTSVTTLRLSASAMGPSGDLSELILTTVRPIAPGLPKTADWRRPR